MLIFSCTTCSRKLSAAEDRIGRQVQCPGCQSVVTVPETGVVDRLRPTGEPPVLRGMDDEEGGRDDDRSPRRRDDRDDRRRRDDDDNPYRRRGPRRRRGGDWADCPNCGCNDATKVVWTWWGGLIGPLIINTVRCRDCGTSYNGNHGDYNNIRILIYMLAPIAIIILLCGGVALMGVAHK